MPFESGNRYGRQGAVVTDTLRRAAMSGDGKLLRQACDKVLRRAAGGDLAALAWVADRLDGRVLPQLPDQGDGTLVVSWVVSAPTTSDRSLSSLAPEVIEHQAPAGSHPANAVESECSPAIEMDGGVGGGGGTPAHTLQVPVPVRSDSPDDAK